MMATEYIDFEAIRAIVKTCIGSTLVRVQWDGEPLGFEGFAGLDQAGLPMAGLSSPATDPAASGGACRVTLSFSTAEQLGVDDMRREYNDTTHQQTLTQFGLRQFTLTIKVESDFSGPTLTICERIRNIMNRVSTRDALGTVGCALREVGQCRPFNVPSWDGKSIDAAILEVFFSCGVVEPDPVGETGTDVPNNWIETVDDPVFEAN
jgi:hypothetical protein